MKILQRHEVNQKDTWNLEDLFLNKEALFNRIDKVKQAINHLHQNFNQNITHHTQAIKALDEMALIKEDLDQIFTYVSLLNSQDQSNQEAMLLAGETELALANSLPLLNFLDQALMDLDVSVLEEVKTAQPAYTKLVNDLLRKKKHRLDPKVQDALSIFEPTLESPYEIYNMAKLVDMTFPNVITQDKNIEMSFGYFEDELAFHPNKEIRHQAFHKFHQSLFEHQHTFATAYKAQILKEKSYAKLQNFDNTLEYLLFDQEIPQTIYEHHLDTIMEELAPHMRKFAKLLQKIHQLDTMSTNDLHLLVDDAFEPDITIEASQALVKEGLSVLGDDYGHMIDQAFEQRWIDFPQNKGKSTGAFCASPYGSHPYILIGWTQKMREAFVLGHELGHAGHFYLAGQHQSIHNMEPSLYLIEAPSTMNELLIANHLKTTNDDPRFKRWVLSTLISRTYYHNFVTHFIEAYFQREVYRKIDQNQAISAYVLNDLFQKTLEKFWGEDVLISENTNLTWMRQPHYYMGLYPYTYSAGLSIATETSQRILRGELSIDKWKEFLTQGGSQSPVELAKIVDIDLNSDQALKNTIQHIGDMVDEIIELTELIDK